MTEGKRVGWTEWDEEDQWWEANTPTAQPVVESANPFEDETAVSTPQPAPQPRAIHHPVRAQSKGKFPARLWWVGATCVVVILIAASVWAGMKFGESTQPDDTEIPMVPSIVQGEFNDDVANLPPVLEGQ